MLSTVAPGDAGGHDAAAGFEYAELQIDFDNTTTRYHNKIDGREVL